MIVVLFDFFVLLCFVIFLFLKSMKELKKNRCDLDEQSAKHYDRLQERLVRWEDNRRKLLTFAINFLLTISIAIIGFIVKNVEGPIFKGETIFCNHSFYKCLLFFFIFSVILGCVVLSFRLWDFYLTAKLVRIRRERFLSKKTNERGGTSSMDEKIQKLKKTTNCLGKLTWIGFRAQFGFFFVGLLLMLKMIF